MRPKGGAMSPACSSPPCAGPRAWCCSAHGCRTTSGGADRFLCEPAQHATPGAVAVSHAGRPAAEPAAVERLSHAVVARAGPQDARLRRQSVLEGGSDAWLYALALGAMLRCVWLAQELGCDISSALEAFDRAAPEARARERCTRTPGVLRSRAWAACTGHPPAMRARVIRSWLCTAPQRYDRQRMTTASVDTSAELLALQPSRAGDASFRPSSAASRTAVRARACARR